MIINSVIAGSGGGSVNLNVVAYSSSFPSTAQENTIGFISSTAASGYVVSNEEPTSGTSEGMVWVKTGWSSSVPIEVSEGVNIYPVAVYQYLNGSFVLKRSKVYKTVGGVSAWYDLMNFIYEDGIQHIAMSKQSGLKWQGSSTTYTNIGTVTFNTDNIYVKGASGKMGAVCTDTAVDMTNYSKLGITYSSPDGGVNVCLSVVPSLTSVINTARTAYIALPATTGYETAEVSITSLSTGYVCCSCVTSNELNVKRLWVS